MENINITLENPNVNNINSVLTGPQGPAGFSPVATVTKSGNVTTITITDEDGTTTAQVLDGTNGADGTPNTLTIGTVSSGATPSATITGTTPNQVLNLVLPKGDTGSAGSDGVTPTITVGSVNTVSPTTPASVFNTGTDTDLVLNFDIPQGIPGSDANCLSVPTIVDELPEVGDPKTFYFVPKTYTSTTVTGDNLSLSITENSGAISSLQINGYTTQSTAPAPVNNLTGSIDIVVDGETYTVDIGSTELCNMNSHTDYIYKNDGDWYIHKETTKIDMGSMPESDWGKSSNGKYYSLNFSTNYGVLDGQVYCNLFNYSATTWDSNTPSFGITNTGTLWCNTGDASITSVALFKQWLETYSAVMYGAMATSTDTLIEDTDLIDALNEIESLRFEQGTVTITTSANVTSNLTLGYYNYDQYNQFDKYVYIIDTSSWEQIN